ncbi:RING-type E3 ubiquitin transferase [Trifolium repens]|nr:RING-type E3 ubiquitin transferase [Trifolium repens]
MIKYPFWSDMENDKPGEKISYIGNRMHEDECIHEPCYCPLSDCDFVASSEILSNHFSEKHRDSQIKLSYDHLFFVSLKSNDETIVLQEENDGKLFILNNSTVILRKAVNICCIGPNSSETEYSYDILARSQRGKLGLQSFAKNVQRFTLATISSEFLLISFESSEPRKLQICINPHYAPMMQICIMTLIGVMIPLRVRSSDTIVDVKKIFDKARYPVHEQRLVFDDRRLEDSQTLANYNTQERLLMTVDVGTLLNEVWGKSHI